MGLFMILFICGFIFILVIREIRDDVDIEDLLRDI